MVVYIRQFKKLYCWAVLKIFMILYIILCTLCTIAMAADYRWYFSQSTGNDITGNGTSKYPWQSLKKVQTQLESLGSGNAVTIYLKRGDKWIINSEKRSNYPTIRIPSSTADRVTITAYGTGALPCIDGNVNWSNPLRYNPPTSPDKSDTFIKVEKSNTTIENLEIKNIYSVPIRIYANGVTIQNNKIHDFGWAAVGQGVDTSLSNVNINHNEIYDSMQLYLHWPELPYGGTLSFFWAKNEQSNIFSHNTIYNTGGEGILVNAGIVENNTIYNCKSTCIHIGAGEGNEDMGTVIVRGNLVFGTKGSKYANMKRDGRYYNSDGIVVQDENIKGKNDKGNASIYNNVVIGCDKGIRIYDNQAQAYEPIQSVKIYNNLLIDNYVNLYLGKVTAFSDIDIYDNISVLYDQVENNFTGGHTRDIKKTLPDSRIYINGNHFYTKNVITPSVNNGFRNNWIITDPKIPGEANGVEWDNLSSHRDLDMTKDLPNEFSRYNSSNITKAPTNLKIINYK